MKKRLLSILSVLCCGFLFLGLSACAKGEKGDMGLQGERGLQGEQGDKGERGENGKSAYQLYKEQFGYEGTEEEWLAALVNGELATKTHTITFKVGETVLASCEMETETVSSPKIPEKEGYSGSWGKYSFTDGNIVVEAVYTPDVVYTLKGETYEVTGLNCDKTDIYILDTYEGKAVTSIKEWAFGHCKSLQFVRIPDSVTEIGEAAFYQCESLMELSLPDGVTKIEDYTFLGCGNLTIVSAENIQSIGAQAFTFCDDLISAPMRSGLRSIGVSAFTECRALRLANIPEGVTSIGRDAFSWCISLAQVLIPSTVTKIESLTFEGCVALERIQLHTGITEIGKNAFQSCDKLERVIFEKIDGWSCLGDAQPVVLQSVDLVNQETAAIFLSYTYEDYTWTRTDE